MNALGKLVVARALDGTMHKGLFPQGKIGS